MQAEWLDLVSPGDGALTRPQQQRRESNSAPAEQRALQLVTLIKEGRAHIIEVREGFFDVKRHAAERPLYRAYTRELAELYFRDVERNHARQAHFESWQCEGLRA